MNPRKTLAAWITEVVTDEEKGEPSQLSLIHTVGIGGQKEIYTKKVVPGIDAAKLAELFRDKARIFAGGFPGQTQRFAVLVFYNGSGEPEGRYPFTVTEAPDEESGDLTQSEPPTQSGSLQQAMRHTEGWQQFNMGFAMKLFDYTFRMMAHTAENNLRLHRAAQDAQESAIEMMAERALNTHSMRMKELEFERGSKQRELLLKYMPALANSVLGKEIFPQSTADTALVETIAEVVTPQQVEQMAAILPPQLLGPLMSRFAQVLEKREREAAEKQSLPKGDPLGELA